jgi:type VI secretion system protein ImpG
MSVNRYYQHELIALRELGKEFAQRNPALAPFLDTPGRDPDVERILEGFAFLAGRLRQKIDDELPEIIHSLFNLLWPNYLRPIPASSIVRYEPSANISGATLIPRGTMMHSIKIEGTHCRFRTVYDTEILPLRLIEHGFLERNGEVSLVLKFKSLAVPLENIPLSKVRFFIHGEPAVAHTIYYSMAARTREVRLILRDKEKKPIQIYSVPAKDSIRPVGFLEEEGLYPYPANTFPGYRLLQEYFCFPEKFLFVEVAGLDHGFHRQNLSAFQGEEQFELHFVLPELPESFESFRLENWQLFCTPVVNLFRMDATPLTLDHRQTEYRVVPDPRLPYHYATYSIDSVSAWGHDDKKSKSYVEFESFEHESAEADSRSYYRRQVRLSHKDGCPETYISFIQSSGGSDLPQLETISMELTCTNRNLPRELAVGDICIPADNMPEMVSFRNITPVVPPFNPPLEGDILWRLLSNMSLNYIALTDISALKAIIAAYDFRARHDRPRARILEKILQGMVSISCRQADRLHNGLPVRGMRTRLVLDQRSFSCEGDMYLFGSVLNEFFALYATVNSFHQLIVVEAKREEEYLWPSRLGKIRLQ